MAEWSPQEQGVRQILEVLRNINNPDAQVQKAINSNLETFKKTPQYNLYLAYIFSLAEEAFSVRTCAGLILKNNLNAGTVAKSEHMYVKNQVVKAIGDADATVRRTAGSLITTIIGVGSIEGWDGIMQFLVGLLEHPDKNVVDGSFYALDLICEDHPYELDSERAGRPLNFLLPKFLSFFNHAAPEFRDYSLGCIVKLLHFLPNQIVLHIDNFMQGFFFLANDSQVSIRKKVVSAFLIFVDNVDGVNVVTPYLPQMIEYILHCMNGPDEEIALRATEFWRLISDHYDVCNKFVAPHLPKILPVLLNKMMYTQEDLENYQYEEDASVPDKPENVKPVTWGHHKDEDDDDDDASNWTIRKCAAEAMDWFSRPFDKTFLHTLLPLIETHLKSDNNWIATESSLLAIGCVAVGQTRDMHEYLPGLVPFFFDLTRHSRPLIRSITCWVLSRYSLWILRQQDRDTYFHRLITELLTRLSTDRNKEVQKAACSALAQICETAAHEIIPYAEAILGEFSKAFATFQRNNLFVLYDAIGAIAEAMGPRLDDEKYLNVLFPPLLEKWNSIPDDDTDLFPLLDCFQHVALALGPSFLPYVGPVFGRCLKLIESTLLQVAMYKQSPHGDPPDREFLICSLDVLSGICSAVKQQIGSFVQGSKLVPLLVEILRDTSSDFSQSSYALTGDLSRYCPEALAPHVKDIMPLLLRGTTYLSYTEMSNNAFWALGEIVVNLSPQKPTQQPLDFLAPFLEPILVRAYEVLNDSQHDDLMEACSVVIARVACVVPQHTINCIEPIFKSFCIGIRNLVDEKEKSDGLRGLCEVVAVKPDIAMKDFRTFCELLGSYGGRNAELRNFIGNLLHQFKNNIGPANWDGMVGSFSNSTQKRLKTEYNL
eukprot:TRINITY_DN5140_c0_g1_i1.p1 TRINITY_DN5140_c0_g1~~TRINITY_DN5140_c0_g1_i1.p1  ORF type:complete len:882 (+),score=197.48 TRINITY_DN5140_c0_g1_i1:2346-4991(+)